MARPHLSHLGIFARDVSQLEKFYASVFGMVTTDRGVGKTFRNELVFMTGDPTQHHQLVLSSGRGPDSPSTIMQLSFKVEVFEELRETREKAIACGAQNMIGLNHGNSWSVYFHDPEGNMVEVYKDTPYHTPQPCGEKLNLEQGEAALMAETKALVDSLSGSKPRPEYAAELSERLG